MRTPPGWDVACLGELFIDMVPAKKMAGQWLYKPSPGGAPGNVAVGLAKLGHRALMISRVGQDGFGRLLIDALGGFGVDTSGVMLAAGEKTGMSVVTLSEEGDRSFLFYHDQPADLHMNVRDIRAEMISQARMVHCGVLPFSGPVSRAAQIGAVQLAAASGIPISCDVNFRPNLWDDPRDMLEAGRFMIARSAIVKMSDEELAALCNLTSDDAVRSLWHDGLRVMSITRGASGAVIFTRDGRFECDGYRVEAIDTTGAGDAYTACLLSGLLALGSADDIEGEIPDLLRRACAAGALATTVKGAMESQPRSTDIETLVTAQDADVRFSSRSQDLG